ncbi:PQQ-binding-like beta-propeller repeat protein [Catenuloplanes japonicus]|uniref:PQQ-binding-like beta-propeller repeat protein n=1 Tax=Catenuloplanes japonicus TaxID=33876 RepID=UPI000525CD36|nr:PQQ-binding-like beta-propeller repeat protein [Catenuloplanes japonicus]
MRRRCLLAAALTTLLAVHGPATPTPAIAMSTAATRSITTPSITTPSATAIESAAAKPAGLETGTHLSGDWTHGHGDAGNTGYQPFTGGLSTTNATRLHEAWQITGTPRGTLAAAGGALYLPVSVEGAGSAIVKLDARTGAALPFGVEADGWLGQPAAVNGTIVTVASDMANRHELRAYTPDGRLRWRVPLRTDRQADDLAVDDGLVFVGGGMDCHYDCAQSRLQAYRLSDGTLAWESDVAGDLQYEAPAVAGGTLVWPMRDSSGTRPVAFDARTGSPRWGAPASRGGISELVVTEDTVYAIEGEELCAWIAATGGKRWCRKDLAYVSVSVAPQRTTKRDTPSVVYTGAGNTLRALDPADGSILWSIRTNGDPRPVTAGGGLVFAQLWRAQDTRIAVLDASDGHILWDRVMSREGIFGTIVPAYGRLYAVDPYESVLALEP